MARDAVPITDSTPTPAEAPSSPLYSPSHPTSPEPRYDSPLYTEINIPLPQLPGTPVTATPTSPTSPESQSRHGRTSSLHAFSPFHRRRTSNAVSASPVREQTARPERRIELSMSGVSRGRKKRSGTIDAAIVPAVMVLRAELFTPGQGDREKNIDTKDKLEVVQRR